MLKKSLIAVASLALFSAAVAEEGESRRFTAERVFDLEYASDPQISPDGQSIIYARRFMDKYTDRVGSNLWMLDTRSGQHRPFLTGKNSSSSVRWSPAGDRIVYMTSTDGKPDLRVMFMDSRQSFSLMQTEHAPSAPVWSPDGTKIAFAMFVPGDKASFAKPPAAPKGAEWSKPVRVFDDLTFRFDGAGYLDKGTTHIFVVPAEGGTPRQLTKGENGFGSPAWLDNDTVLAVGNDVENADLDPIESEIYAIELSDLSRRALTTRDGPDQSPAVAPNGRRIAYLGYDDELKAYQQTDVYVMNADGSSSRNLTAEYDRSIGSIAWKPDGSGLIAQAGVDGELALLSISLSGNVTMLTNDVGGTSIGRPYGGGSFSVSSQAGGGRPFIAYTSASADRPADVSYMRAGGTPRVLTDLNSDLFDHLDMARVEEIKVPSRHDGLEIEAWVALPPDFVADGSFPMILEIHGGPFAMYGPFFAAEIQRFAAEGYVTVYVNPRGSTGYGEAFAQEIDLAYPGNDHEDLMSVVDALIEKNYVSEERLFITGGSGGGVLTAWAVGKTDRFAAAATIKPVINWTTMALSADIARFVSRHWLRAQPWENRELYWRLSPISLVGNVTTPTMVMVGEEDWRTPTWEAEQFYTALKVQDVDTVLVRIPGASHSIASRPSRLIAKVDNIMGWFEKYDPAKQDENNE
jgi:acylaminoacyl-peptidase